RDHVHPVTSRPATGRRKHRPRRSAPGPRCDGHLPEQVHSGDRRWRQADGTGERCYLSTWRIAPFGRFWQARHPPRYAASLKPSSPRFTHSSKKSDGESPHETFHFDPPLLRFRLYQQEAEEKLTQPTQAALPKAYRVTSLRNLPSCRAPSS